MNRRRDMANRSDLKKLSLRASFLFLLSIGWLSACDLDYPTSRWGDTDADHTALSGGFELIGVHQDAACSSCHAAGNYELKFQPANNQDCEACHLADYEDKHGAQGYPTDCTICHTATDWDDGSFNHETTSGGFDLWGPHASAACSACHVADTFAPKFDPANSSDCTACHHLPDSGGFDLWGPHAAAECTACHEAGTFALKFNPANSGDCAACH